MAGLVCVRALKINRAAGTVVRHRLFTSTAPSSAGADPGPVIKNMSVADFNKILAGSERLKYQIIDVREKDELQAVALSGDDILNLPLSEASIWSQRVLDGELLDKQKPLLCLCKMGGRSMKAATFFGKFGSHGQCCISIPKRFKIFLFLLQLTKPGSLRCITSWAVS